LENCERLVLVNRTFDKAQALARELADYFRGPRVLGPAGPSAGHFQTAPFQCTIRASPPPRDAGEAMPAAEARRWLACGRVG
jgi:shikimate 5-dehydrogenase